MSEYGESLKHFVDSFIPNVGNIDFHFCYFLKQQIWKQNTVVSVFKIEKRRLLRKGSR